LIPYWKSDNTAAKTALMGDNPSRRELPARSRSRLCGRQPHELSLFNGILNKQMLGHGCAGIIFLLQEGFPAGRELG